MCVGGIKGERDSGIDRLKFASCIFLMSSFPCRIDGCGCAMKTDGALGVLPGSTKELFQGQLAGS